MPHDHPDRRPARTVIPSTGVPSTGVPSTGVPSTGVPSTGVPSTGIPGTGGAARRALRLGIGGPVGSGKTALVAALCQELRRELALAVVTNDIYTTTGCCPHTAIRDDIAANLEAADDLEHDLGPLDLLIIESGGDNLTATFSRGLVDAQVFVLDVSGGDKVPRKGGPGVSLSDLLVINKTDLAGYVGADLSIMARDAEQVRHGRPVIFSSLREHPRAPEVTDWVRAVVRERAAA